MSTSVRPAGRIDTREELLNALTEAAELEHGLLVQYLFAAVSMKRSPDEGVTWAQLERIRTWEAAVLEVAREEMAHLGTVNNLLVAIGGAQHFNRPNFPQRPTYYPANVTFTLQRFSTAALDRFIEFERPEDEDRVVTLGVAPDPLLYTRVGDLYRQIREAFRHMDEGWLFIGPPEAQDKEDWSARLRLTPVRDRASAVAAVDFIIEDGEGTPASRDSSHYATFVRIREELETMRQADPGFDPARPVGENPMTRPHRDASSEVAVTLLTSAPALAVAELCNAVYGTMLLALMQFYAWGDETSQQRAGLRAAARQLMSGVLRPLGEMLTRMPATKAGPSPAAGPGFELYADLRVPTSRPNAWTILYERLTEEAAAAGALADETGVPPRLRLVAENLHVLAANVGRLIASAPANP